MAINSQLPFGSLPHTGYGTSETLFWKHDGKQPSNYWVKSKNLILDEHVVPYQFNSLGYRSPEFSCNADVRILAVGCSYVFGFGLLQEHTFHEQFAARLRANLPSSVILWNLGLLGGSNDYISRLLQMAIPYLNPHVVLVNFTHAARREYISVQNKYVNYIPSYSPREAVLKDVYRHFEALSSPYDDQLNFFRNYKAVERALVGRHWLWSAIFPREIEPIAEHLDARRNVGQFHIVDRARDAEHPGPESNRMMADLYWSKFVDIGGLRLPLGTAVDTPRTDVSNT